MGSDILLIHAGGNVMEPLGSPFTYQTDYTHWRDYGIFGYDIIFKELWGKNTSIIFSSYINPFIKTRYRK